MCNSCDCKCVQADPKDYVKPGAFIMDRLGNKVYVVGVNPPEYGTNSPIRGIYIRKDDVKGESCGLKYSDVKGPWVEPKKESKWFNIYKTYSPFGSDLLSTKHTAKTMHGVLNTYRIDYEEGKEPVIVKDN